MAELIAVASPTLSFKSDPPGYTVVVLPVSIKSPFVSCKGYGAYHLISFTCSKGSYVGAGVINGSSSKVKSTGADLAFVRKGDSVDIVAAIPPPSSATEDVTIEVDNPGQDVTEAE